MAIDRPLVLTLRALGLGDLLTAVPALRALADAFPGHHKVLAGPRALEPLARLTGAVDEVLPTAALTTISSNRRPDVAVNLHGRGPQSHRVLLATRPKRLVAFAHSDLAAPRNAPEWASEEHEVNRWCRLLAESGMPADPTRLELPRPRRPRRALVNATVIHPGAAFESRHWPVQRWAAVAAAEAAAGRKVVITGGPRETHRAHAVAAAAGLPDGSVRAGGTSIRDLVRIVAFAHRVVCSDTGIAHLATALRTASVILFGPDPPTRWGPPTNRPWHRALWAGRTGNPHAHEPDPGLLAITVDDVLTALDDLPDVPRPGGQFCRDAAAHG